MRLYKLLDMSYKIYPNGTLRDKKPHSYSILSLVSYLFCFLPFTVSGQLLDSLSLDTMVGCNNIHQAMLNPENVIKLDLSKNKLKDVPADIRKLTNLQYLDLSKNKITSLPSWIGELKSLQFLILSKNKIDSLPPQFGDLTHLKYFVMNRSELTSLPHTIGKLKELHYMDLWDDNISNFPYELKNISGNLETLDLRDVLVNNATQAYLKSLLPTTSIYFSPSCPCEK
jgi:Leucine-rich repeat (LRR) protein